MNTTSPPKKRRALITGGGSGIGLAIAKALAASGAEVTVAGRDEAKLKASGCAYVAMDVTDEASVIAGVKAAGEIDIFVNNAGFAATAPSLKTTRDLWNEMLALNLTGAFICSQAVVPAMVARGWGRFIAVASTASFKAYPYTGAYAAAKHGVLGWIKTLALEHAKSGVTFNALCPGFTDTPLIESALNRIAAKKDGDMAAARTEFARVNPMGRLVLPDEVAAAAVFLASDGAASINGQSIIIDGGEMIA
jgi:NAD(P)-dependent dehydrogenase (short-subunit alcohol dehydrogenase family)